jgi:hypothetical protein
MSEADNPASRLIAIIKKAQAELSPKHPNQPPRNAAEGWARVFRTGDSTSIAGQLEIISRIVEASKLVNEVENRLRDIEGINLDRYLLPFPPIRALFSNVLNLQNATFQPQTISETHMAVLGFCEDKLAEYHSEPVIEEDVLKELLSDVNSLYEEIQASSISSELKTLILDMLHIIQTAIHEYRIRGVTRLKEALERIVGIYFINHDIVDAEADKESVSKFKKYLSKFTTAVTFATKLTKLIESGATIVGFLTPGGPTVPPT